MTEYVIEDTDMKKVADSIRAKGKTSAKMTFPDGMVSAVKAIPDEKPPVLVPTTVDAPSAVIYDGSTPVSPTIVAPLAGQDGFSSVTINPVKIQNGIAAVSMVNAQTITPGFGAKGLGEVVINAEPDLLPGNILKGKTICNVEGTLEAGEGSGDIYDPMMSGDSYIARGWITTEKTYYISSPVYATIISYDGTVWVKTSKGYVVYPMPQTMSKSAQYKGTMKAEPPRTLTVTYVPNFPSGVTKMRFLCVRGTTAGFVHGKQPAHVYAVDVTKSGNTYTAEIPAVEAEIGYNSSDGSSNECFHVMGGYSI